MSSPKKNKNVVSYRETRDLQKGIELIQEVLDNLKKGPVTVQQNDQSITVSPSKDVRLTIKAKQHGAEESIEFKMKWSAVAPSAQVLDGDGAPIIRSDVDAESSEASSESSD